MRAIRSILISFSLSGALAFAADAQILKDELPGTDGVGIVERLDESVPLDATFRNAQGETVAIGDLLRSDRPAILTFNFFRCTHLCDLTLNGLVDCISDMEWSVGDEYDIITVSIADEEGPDLADVKKRGYLNRYDRETADRGWHFLTGEREQIDALATAAGFGYRRVDTKDTEYDYAHTSSIMFLTPDGRLSRYMNDVAFAPEDVRLALIEASEGQIGSPMEKFLVFYCFQYDPDSNSYAASAVKVLRLAGAMTIVLIVAGVGLLWLRGPRHRDAVLATEKGESES